MVDEDPEDVLASGLFSLYSELPPVIAPPSHSKIFTYRGISVITPSTNNWQLQAHGIWRSSFHLVDRLEAIFVNLLHYPGDSTDVDVLELGASTGLAGLHYARSFMPKSMTLSDYPDPSIMDTLLKNVELNRNLLPPTTSFHVLPHKWGDLATLLPPPSPISSDSTASVSLAQYSVIIAADVLWLPEEHANLVRTLVHSLCPEPNSFIFIVAGLHTGRGAIDDFVRIAKEAGLHLWRMVEAKAPAAVDDDDANEYVARDWASVRVGETPSDRALWLVEIVLGWPRNRRHE